MKSIEVMSRKDLQQITGGSGSMTPHNGTTQSGANLWGD
ncbi:MAG TPA: hypothetical protein DCE41_01075 [Cytophagales bacterium]|nr:hypothetical protein [Cytophagales bacterium]HAA24069.1 hypothetical protein [Cytophagales bacterium]